MTKTKDFKCFSTGLQIDERIRRLKGLLQFVVATGYYDNIISQNDNIAIKLLQFVEKCLVAKVGSEVYLEAATRINFKLSLIELNLSFKFVELIVNSRVNSKLVFSL